MGNWKDYPSGDGRPDCPDCHGRGVVPLPRELRPKFAVGELTQICKCVLVRDIRSNLERGWRGLSKAKPIKESALKGREKDNLVIMATAKSVKENLKHVASRMGPRWGFQVTSDAAMMDAWLSKGLARVHDADVEEMRVSDSRKPAIEKSPYEALSELVEPASLLVVILGVKAARNSAMPEVLLEALTLRDFAGHPTWLVEQPVCPLTEGHLSWSPSVESWISSWDRIVLNRLSVASTPVRPGPPQEFNMGGKSSPSVLPEEPVSDSSSSDSFAEWQRTEDERMQARERKQWKKRKKTEGGER